MNRRNWLRNAAGLLLAPAVVRAESLMPVRRLAVPVQGVVLAYRGFMLNVEFDLLEERVIAHYNWAQVAQVVVVSKKELINSNITSHNQLLKHLTTGRLPK